MGQTLHEAIITDPRKLAREIASDIMASEDEIAVAINLAINAAYERAAKVAEDSVRQKCCGHGRVVYGSRGEPVGEECCGNPDIEPMYPDEIASSIRSLKTESSNEHD
jgi:hypothetical protein